MGSGVGVTEAFRFDRNAYFYNHSGNRIRLHLGTRRIRMGLIDQAVDAFENEVNNLKLNIQD